MRIGKRFVKTLPSFLVFVSILAATVPAQGADRNVTPAGRGREFRFEHITLKDGLSHGNIHAICQDRQGFLWFGTSGGLDRYDGYAIKTYRHNPDDQHSLIGTSVQDVIEDAHGILWVATNEGVNRFDRTTERFTRYTHDPNTPDSISGNDVWRILEDSRGDFWALTTDGGLNKFDRKTGRFVAFKHDPKDPQSLGSNEGRSLYEDSKGNLWVGTQGGGLNKFDPATGGFIHYRHNPQDPHSLSQDAVWAICEDHRGILWVGTIGQGINSFDPETEKFTRYSSHPDFKHSASSGFVFGITESTDGILWVATYGGGLYLLDKERKRFTNYLPNPSDPTSISLSMTTVPFEDRQGAMWIGTWGMGVNRLDRNAAKFLLYSHNSQDSTSLSSGKMTSVHEDRDGVLWIGAEGSGLNRFHRATGTFTHFKYDPDNPRSLSSNAVYAIYQDTKKNLWVGTRGGLNKMNAADGTFTRYLHDPDNPDSIAFNDVRGIGEDPGGTLWIATSYGGLNRFDRQTGRFKAYKHDPGNPDSLGRGIISTMYCDPTGIVWLGLWGGGLNRFDPSTETFKRYERDPDNPASISDNQVWNIMQSKDGALWLGTSGGLNRFDIQTERFSVYRRKDGLSSDHISSILEDAQGRLWLGTDESGITVLDTESGKTQVYDATDGLHGDHNYANAACKSHTGELIFAGQGGFNIIDPGHINKNRYEPPVVLTHFDIFNKPVSVNDENSPLKKTINETEQIALSHHQSVFSIGFAALNYRVPQKNQYAYMLDGFEKKWNYVDSRRRLATYTNLDPGTYTFHVRASNNDGLWNKTGKSIQIVIIPPWWQTLWFRTMAVTAVLLLFAVGFQWRVRSVKNRNRELQEQVDEKTRDLQEAKEQAEAANKAKSIFLANMSHELRTPLNAVLGFAEILFHKEKEPSKKSYLKCIQTSGTSLLSLINDVLDLSKIEAGKMELTPSAVSVKGLCNEMRAIFQHKLSEKDVQFTIDIHQGLPDALLLDKVRVRQVLINLLSNAAKFTDEGFVRLSIRTSKAAISGAGAIDLFIEVADSGRGIPEQAQDSIFEAFEQVTGQKRSATDGTGLGLSITYNIVRLMRGSITLDSEPGKGAVFTVSIPGVEIISADAGEREDQALTFDPAQVRFEPATILIADDIEYNRDVFAAYLDLPNITHCFAVDGQQALERATSDKPDLIVMDYIMPVMNGFEASKRLKEQPSTSDIPIIAVTASALKQDEKKIRQYCDTFLRKPIDQYTLINEIKKFLPHTQTPPTAAFSDAADDLVIPGSKALQTLYNIAQDGDMDEITSFTDQLAEKDHRLRPFCDRVKRLASGYEYDKIIHMLKETINASAGLTDGETES